MPRFNFENPSDAEDLSPEKEAEIKKPIEGGDANKQEWQPRAGDEVFDLNQEDKNAPVIPSDPTKREDWARLLQEQQMKLHEEYKEQKKAREKWEKEQEAQKEAA